MRKFVMLGGLWAASATLMISGCGSTSGATSATDGSASTDASEMWSGPWTGTWTSTPAHVSGTFSVIFSNVQDGMLVGRVDIQGSTFTGGDVMGTVTGNVIQFGSVRMGATMGITFDGTVAGNTMSGSYSTTDGDTGTWRATR